MPYLARIHVHPIKSLGPVSLRQVRIVENGGLEHDRELAFFDDQGKFVNGKRNEKVHALRAIVEWKDGTVTIRSTDTEKWNTFHLHHQKEELNAWLSAYFEAPVEMRRNVGGGFPDDLNSPGPTVIGAGTLDEINDWYDGAISVRELRIRFRANLEVGDAPKFWEDRLFGEPETVRRFRIGDVVFDGVKPCQRCVVPTRDSANGEQFPEFSNIFRQKRQETLPDWAVVSRFNHFYRLAVNTRVPESEIGKILRIGDEIALVE